MENEAVIQGNSVSTTVKRHYWALEPFYISIALILCKPPNLGTSQEKEDEKHKTLRFCHTVKMKHKIEAVQL